MTPAVGAREFATALLPPTLENALRTPFYREKWGGIDVSGITLEHLEHLPFVYKRDLVAAGPRAQMREGLVCDEIFTSGTTGQPLVTVKGQREQEVAQRFFRSVFDEAYEPPLARGLLINNPYHGHQVFIPAPVHLHKIGMYDRCSFEHGWRVLAETHSDDGVEERCTVLVALERCLRAFTLEALKRRPADWRGSLRQVFSYGHCLTRRWRERLETAWETRVVDRFGLSEVFGGATQNPVCGWWQFDPMLVAEVVGGSSLRPLREGIGMLVLTPLVPFQEAQPLVRYWTGDLVEVTHTRSSRPNEIAIRPLGRARCGTLLPDTDDWLVTPMSLFELVDELPEVARVPLFCDSLNVSDPTAIGHPKYRIEHEVDGSIVRIRIALALGAAATSGRDAQIQKTIIDGLIAQNQPLADAASRGRASVAVHVVDDLTSDVISYSN